MERERESDLFNGSRCSGRVTRIKTTILHNQLRTVCGHIALNHCCSDGHESSPQQLSWCLHTCWTTATGVVEREGPGQRGSCIPKRSRHAFAHYVCLMLEKINPARTPLYIRDLRDPSSRKCAHHSVSARTTPPLQAQVSHHCQNHQADLNAAVYNALRSLRLRIVGP